MDIGLWIPSWGRIDGRDIAELKGSKLSLSLAEPPLDSSSVPEACPCVSRCPCSGGRLAFLKRPPVASVALESCPIAGTCQACEEPPFNDSM